MHLRNRHLQNKIKICKNLQKSPNYALGAGGRGFESRYPDTRKKPFRQLWKAFLCFATKHPILPVFAQLTRFFDYLCKPMCSGGYSELRKLSPPADRPRPYIAATRQQQFESTGLAGGRRNGETGRDNGRDDGKGGERNDERDDGRGNRERQRG